MERGSGKTTRLIHLSAHKNIPIIVSTYAQKSHIIEHAKRIGIEIPNPITIFEFESMKISGSNHINNGVIIDDAQYIIQRALESYFDAPVLAISTSIPMKEYK